MALRRVLPSRLTGAPPPEAPAVPVKPAVEAETRAAESAAVPAVPAAPVVQTSPAPEAMLAVAGSSAFGTLASAVASPATARPEAVASAVASEPVAGDRPARVLEESFGPAVPMSEGAVSLPQEVSFSAAAAASPATVPDVPVVPEPASAAVQPVPPVGAEELRTEAVAPAVEAVPVEKEVVPEVPVVATLPQEPVAAASKPQAEAMPEPQVAQVVADVKTEKADEPKSAVPGAENVSAPVAEEPAEVPQAVAARPVAVPAEPEEPIVIKPVPEALEILQGPTDFLNDPGFKPSKPDDNPLRRQVGKPSPVQPKGPRPQQRPSGPEHGRQQSSSRAAEMVREAARNTAAPSRSGQRDVGAPAAKNQEPQRVRVKRERDFAAATIAAPAARKASPAEGTARMAEIVPVSTRPLDRVDEELIASGIIAPPPADSLTSDVPVSLAESESPLPVLEEPVRAESSLSPLPSLPVLPDPLPAVQSDLPWANAAASAPKDWDVDVPPAAVPQPPAGAQSVPPPVDIYKSLNTVPAAVSAPASWSMPARSSLPPPELPGARGSRGPSMGNRGGSSWGLWLGGAAAAVIAVFVYVNNSGQDQLQGKVAQWTGALSQRAETPVVAANTPSGSSFSMAPLPSSSVSSNSLLPPPAPVVATSQAPGKSSSQIDFADVPSDQAGKPIMADGSESMPEDVSLIARFQKAVVEARNQKAATTGVQPVPETQAVAASQGSGDKLTPEKLQEELKAYRQALADGAVGGQKVIKPGQLNQDPDAYMDGNQMASAQDGASQPVAGGAGDKTLLPPPDLYSKNPKNLPVVGEPAASTTPRVRTLADFEDAGAFEPDREKVRIPRGLRPKMAASDFPSLEVLSFVPQKGIIAYASGREGVLLIGETLDGWELTNVTTELAEFRAGQKRHYVSAND